MPKRPWLKMVIASSLCCALAGLVLAPVSFAEDAKPKHTIKEVMKIAQKEKLANKVASGNASEEEKKLLLDVFVSLLESKPPKGDMGSWQELTGNAALAAAKVVVGREGAEAELKAANNCKACHSVHKP